jgi:phosphoenolpyruvate phosphomutase
MTFISPQSRLSSLRSALAQKPLVRALEAHNGLSAMVVENTGFDAIWLSSLTDSTAKGKPDIELVDLTSRIVTVNDILECTTKPIIYDGDTGGLPEHFAYTIRRLERLGVSAAIIEDKTGAKRNSLLDPNKTLHVQESIENMAAKIRAGKSAQITQDFMLFARIESLIVEAGMDDALARARAYIDAGADGIMIHSRKAGGEEIFAFCEEYRSFGSAVPLVAVPTNYATVPESELARAGVRIEIYANQLLRAAYTGMEKAAQEILKQGRSFEADQNYISALGLIELVEGN